VRLQAILKLLSLSRQRRRVSYVTHRACVLRLLERKDEAKSDFFGHMTSCKCKGSMELLSGLCSGQALEGQRLEKLTSLAVCAFHGAKAGVAGAAWTGFVQPLLDELERVKHQTEALQRKFCSARTEYLREVSALRDEVRVRGDPESCLNHRSTDVTFFYEPLDALSIEEKDFVMKIVTEKLKMIFETNAKVAKTLDFGQVSQLEGLFVASEARHLKEALVQRQKESFDLHDQVRRLQRELAICERARRNAMAALSEAGARRIVGDVEDLQQRLDASEAARHELSGALRAEGKARETQRIEYEGLRRKAHEDVDGLTVAALQASQREALSKSESEAALRNAQEDVESLTAAALQASQREAQLSSEVKRLEEHARATIELKEELQKIADRCRLRECCSSHIIPTTPGKIGSQTEHCAFGYRAADEERHPRAQDDEGRQEVQKEGRQRWASEGGGETLIEAKTIARVAQHQSSDDLRRRRELSASVVASATREGASAAARLGIGSESAFIPTEPEEACGGSNAPEQGRGRPTAGHGSNLPPFDDTAVARSMAHVGERDAGGPVGKDDDPAFVQDPATKSSRHRSRHRSEEGKQVSFSRSEAGSSLREGALETARDAGSRVGTSGDPALVQDHAKKLSSHRLKEGMHVRSAGTEVGMAASLQQRRRLHLREPAHEATQSAEQNSWFMQELSSKLDGHVTSQAHSGIEAVGSMNLTSEAPIEQSLSPRNPSDSKISISVIAPLHSRQLRHHGSSSFDDQEDSMDFSSESGHLDAESSSSTSPTKASQGTAVRAPRQLEPLVRTRRFSAVGAVAEDKTVRRGDDFALQVSDLRRKRLAAEAASRSPCASPAPPELEPEALEGAAGGGPGMDPRRRRLAASEVAWRSTCASPAPLEVKAEDAAPAPLRLRRPASRGSRGDGVAPPAACTSSLHLVPEIVASVSVVASTSQGRRPLSPCSQHLVLASSVVVVPGAASASQRPPSRSSLPQGCGTPMTCSQNSSTEGKAPHGRLAPFEMAVPKSPSPMMIRSASPSPLPSDDEELPCGGPSPHSRKAYSEDAAHFHWRSQGAGHGLAAEAADLQMVPSPVTNLQRSARPYK